MVKVQFTYYEIQDQDFTGIRIQLIDKDGSIAATYRNFNPEDYPDNGSDVIGENQTEEFEVGTMKLARHFIESNQNYMEVKEVF